MGRALRHSRVRDIGLDPRHGSSAPDHRFRRRGHDGRLLRGRDRSVPGVPLRDAVVSLVQPDRAPPPYPPPPPPTPHPPPPPPPTPLPPTPPARPRPPPPHPQHHPPGRRMECSHRG